MRALVTGGGGFIGGRLALMLRERDVDVTAIGRRDYPFLQAVGVKTTQCDIRDAAAVRQACAGMDVVFHVAGITGVWGRRKTFWSINVDGTQNVIDACRACGVPRLVFTSSPSVVFGEGDLCGVDESQPYPTKYLAHYPPSKAEAERRVLAANGTGLSTVAIRPHLVWGPGDPHLIPRVIDRARRGRLICVGSGKNEVDITYIDNVADAHLAAADRLGPEASCAGRAYFISQGAPVRLWDWLYEVVAALDIPVRRRSMSYATAKRIGAVLETLYRLVGLRSEPPMTRFVASQLAKTHYFDISAARRDLGYEPRVSTETGTKRLIESLLRDGPGG